jgi:hypothetical protein
MVGHWRYRLADDLRNPGGRFRSQPPHREDLAADPSPQVDGACHAIVALALVSSS